MLISPRTRSPTLTAQSIVTKEGLYDQGYGKLRALLTLDKTADRMSGTGRADIFSPGGILVASFSHALHFTRIEIESLD